MKDERLVSKIEGKTNFSRRLKRFDGLTQLTLSPPPLFYDRSTYATGCRYNACVEAVFDLPSSKVCVVNECPSIAKLGAYTTAVLSVSRMHACILSKQRNMSAKFFRSRGCSVITVSRQMRGEILTSNYHQLVSAKPQQTCSPRKHHNSQIKKKQSAEILC